MNTRGSYQESVTDEIAELEEYEDALRACQIEDMQPTPGMINDEKFIKKWALYNGYKIFEGDASLKKFIREGMEEGAFTVGLLEMARGVNLAHYIKEK